MAGIDDYTKLLLHCNGADESTTFTDSSYGGKTVTANGNAQIDTAQYRLGSSSGLFDGTGDYLSVPNNADFNFGSGDFTLDFWVRLADNPAEYQTCFFSNCNVGTGATSGWFLGYNYSVASSIYTLCFDDTNSVNRNFSWHPEVNTWYHIAVVRNGTELKAYSNGVQIGNTADAFDPPDSTESLLVGAHRVHTTITEFWNGWLDEIRISKGIARWKDNFTPPTSEYSVITDSQPMYFSGGVVLG